MFQQRSSWKVELFALPTADQARHQLVKALADQPRGFPPVAFFARRDAPMSASIYSLRTGTSKKIESPGRVQH